MAMGIDLIVQNLDISFEIVMSIIFYLGGLLFYAKDFRLGTFLHAAVFMGLTAWFYEFDMVWQIPLIIMIAHIIIMAFTIFALAKRGRTGGSLV